MSGSARRVPKERASPVEFTPLSGGTGGGGGRGGEETGKHRPSAESKVVQESYGPVEDGSRKEPPLLPVV